MVSRRGLDYRMGQLQAVEMAVFERSLFYGVPKDSNAINSKQT